MKTIKIKIKDNMDVGLLLTGINFLRSNNLEKSRRYIELPKKFNKEIINECVDDYDRLNTLACQLSELITK